MKVTCGECFEVVEINVDHVLPQVCKNGHLLVPPCSWDEESNKTWANRIYRRKTFVDQAPWFEGAD